MWNLHSQKHELRASKHFALSSCQVKKRSAFKTEKCPSDANAFETFVVTKKLTLRVM